MSKSSCLIRSSSKPKPSAIWQNGCVLNPANYLCWDTHLAIGNHFNREAGSERRLEPGTLNILSTLEVLVIHRGYNSLSFFFFLTMLSFTLVLAALASAQVAAAQDDLKINVTHHVQCSRKSKNEDRISVNYNGTFTNGTLFDSSRGDLPPETLKIITKHRS